MLSVSRYVKSGEAVVVNIGGLEVFFSYATPIAFRESDGGLTLSENIWSTTTGRHLNAISRTAPRLPRDEFERRLEAALRRACEGLASG